MPGAAPILRHFPSAPGVLFDADFSTQAAGGGSIAGYAPLTFTSGANANRTVQTGTATVASGGTIGNANTPRFGRSLDAHEIGLGIENWAGNKFTDSRNIVTGVNTGAGVTVVSTANAAAGPDGNVLADQQNVTSGGYSRFWISTNFGSSQVVNTSSWMRTVAGSQQAEAQSSDLFAVAANYVYNATTAWQRVKGQITVVAGGTFRAGWVPFDARGTTIPAANVNGYCDMAQCQAGKLANDVEATAGAAGTGWNERLAHPTASAIVDRGRVAVYLRFRAKAAFADMPTGTMTVVYSNANNVASIASGTGAVTITVAGVAYACPTAITWADGDLVELWIAAGGGALATIAQYRLNGGAAVTLSTGAATVQGTFATPGGMDICHAAAANTLQCWLNRVTFYGYNSHPAWAA